MAGETLLLGLSLGLGLHGIPTPAHRRSADVPSARRVPTPSGPDRGGAGPHRLVRRTLLTPGLPAGLLVGSTDRFFRVLHFSRGLI